MSYELRIGLEHRDGRMTAIHTHFDAIHSTYFLLAFTGTQCQANIVWSSNTAIYTYSNASQPTESVSNGEYETHNLLNGYIEHSNFVSQQQINRHAIECPNDVTNYP